MKLGTFEFVGKSGEIHYTTPFTLQRLGCKGSWVQIPPRRPYLSLVKSNISTELRVPDSARFLSYSLLSVARARNRVRGESVGKKEGLQRQLLSLSVVHFQPKLKSEKRALSKSRSWRRARPRIPETTIGRDTRAAIPSLQFIGHPRGIGLQFMGERYGQDYHRIEVSGRAAVSESPHRPGRST